MTVLQYIFLLTNVIFNATAKHILHIIHQTVANHSKQIAVLRKICFRSPTNQTTDGEMENCVKDNFTQDHPKKSYYSLWQTFQGNRN